MDIDGQWRFGNEMNTRQVPCPRCKAGKNEPCRNQWGEPLIAGMIHGSRLCVIVDEHVEPNERPGPDGTGKSS